MYKFRRILLVSVFMLMLISCDSFLDVNTNPNVPASVPEDLILTSILSRHSYQVVGSWPARHGVKWAQQIAWCAAVPPTWDNYDLTEGGSGTSWTFGYANVIKNAVELDKIATENGNYAYAAIAKIIIAWNLSVLTDTYGDIPWEEALDPVNYPQPRYQSQREIYEVVFEYLNGALEDFQRTSPLKPSTHDLVYHGNMAHWEQLAYSLIARFQMRLSFAPGENTQARAQAAIEAAQNGLLGNAQNAIFEFGSEEGAHNPWHQFTRTNWDDRDRLSYHYVQLLKSLNDPRLPIQLEPTVAPVSDGTFYGGHVNGLPGGSRDTVSHIGDYYAAANAPLYLFHYPELLFIEAEAVLLTQGQAAAHPVFRDAVSAHMDKLGVDASDRNLYLNALPDLGSLTFEEAHEQIMIQKYIANFLSPEVWVDWRRTNYPQLTPVTHDVRVDEIPRRFPYPLTEWQYNAQNVSATGVPLGYHSMKSRVWWDPN